MAAQLHIIDDTALRDDVRLRTRPSVRQPCESPSASPLSSSTVADAAAQIIAINKKREDLGIGHEKFAQKAGISFWTWRDLRRGAFRPTPATLKKLRAALGEVPEAKPPQVVKGFHRLVMIEIARTQQIDIETVLTTDFTVQRPHAPQWLASSRVRLMAIYITAVELEVGNADLARALGVSREAVRKARMKIEDLREADHAVNDLLDRIAGQVRG
ncbi:helix-turn-helix domain-containing protein [Afipia felis]|uniref:Helix-turn-helix n=2 Tax=Afipia felis TaxID=1035 RepID=A0A380W6X6_AFIFE|nr:helix-turn-helix transcriptional regulator [Afipia felis]EKS26705.1 hypothetical protein HMPREF9697_04008 [Afipia felis ATCC 53690]SUU76146.1 Helix-turn-helix [Afipia felis]SUU84213.1 Helix-turn-helix [Afipia felis]SUW28225.1 Helix-turn-helix [Afipia felis]